jgi:PAS domain S-box-containing protein
MEINRQIIGLPQLEDFINYYPVTIRPHLRIIDAIHLMSRGTDQPSNYVLVVEAEQLIGILTAQDVLRLISLGTDLCQTTIADVMITNVVTMQRSEIEDINAVLFTIQQHDIQHLPIVDNQNKLLGIITTASLWRAFDVLKMFGVITALQQHLAGLSVNLLPHNELDQIRCKTYDIVQQWIEQKSQQLLIINQELQQTIEELQIVEEEIRQQNEQLLIAREKLDIERQRYQDLFEFAPHGYLVTDKAGIIQECNQAAASLLSIKQEYIVGKPLIVFIAQADRHDFMSRLMNLQHLQDWELEIQPRTGQLIPASVRVAGIYNYQGELTGWRWLICNISQRKLIELELRQAREELEKRVAERTAELVAVNEHLQQEIIDRQCIEQELIRSEGKFRYFTENINAVIWFGRVNANENMYVNPAYEKIWGRSCQSLNENPNSWIEAIHPEDVHLILEKLEQEKEGKATNLEYRIIKPNGCLRWIWERSFPIQDEQGNMYCYGGIAEDITERKQAEQKISEQAALLDIATDAIFVRDFQNQILFWNQGAEKIYGWSKQEIGTKNVNEIFYNDLITQPEEIALSTVIETGVWQGELRKLTKNKQEILVESRWTLMRDDAGQPKSILTVDTDITESKLLEEQFFRTQRLESIGTLAGGISHDLNNVLTPIITAAQILKTRNNKNEERQQQLLNIIETNAKRGAALVKQVLSFARGFKGERTIVQIRHLIMEIVQIGRQTFPKSIDLITQIQEDLSPVCGDSTQLHQVLMNLVVNARDAMPEEGKLTISAENLYIDEAYGKMNLDAKVGNYTVITVQDTGIGMSPEILERIFEPFFTTKELGTGTGLGLSTVLGIVKSHDGFLTVNSQIGEGSKFQIFLPAVAAPIEEETDNLELLQGQGELILLVDDESYIQDVTKMILEKYNYRTLSASNGIEAIALYAQHQQEVSAVLMDIMMPEMNGNNAISALRKMNSQLPIMACTGLNTTEVLQPVVQDVEAVLAKPFTAKDLLQNLHQILQTSSLA